jgi:hypothetical protein
MNKRALLQEEITLIDVLAWMRVNSLDKDVATVSAESMQRGDSTPFSTNIRRWEDHYLVVLSALNRDYDVADLRNRDGRLSKRAESFRRRLPRRLVSMACELADILENIERLGDAKREFEEHAKAVPA